LKPKKPKTSNYEKNLAMIKSTHDLPDQEAVVILLDCVKKGSPLAAVKAVRLMAERDHPTVLQSLIEAYDWIEADPNKRDVDCHVRQVIAGALGDWGSPLSVEILRKAVRTVKISFMDDLAIGLRATAAISLAKVDPDALYELSLLLFDDNEKNVPVRMAAAQALSVLGDPGGMLLLAIKLKFPQNEAPEVLAECLESLIFMNPPYLMEIVKPYLRSNDEYLTSIAALALAENRGAEVLDLLLEILEQAVRETKETIVVAISLTRCNEARQLLLDYLGHQSYFVRRGAVKGLKAYLDDEVREKLQIIHATDREESVRLEASLD